MSYEKKGTLHRSHENEFKAFLIHQGFVLEQPADSQVIKARHVRTKEWVIVYDGSSPEHFTVQVNMRKQVKRFYSWKRGDLLL